MAKEKNPLVEKALSYIFEDLGAGEPQRVIDNVQELISKVDKEITAKEDEITSSGILFAEAFNNIRKGVLETKVAVAAVRDVNALKLEIEALKLVLDVLVLVDEVITDDKNESNAEKMINLLTDEVSKKSKKKGN